MIKDLKAKQTNVDVTGDIIEKGDVREFQKFGKSGKVCNAVLKDESGKIKLSLWNEQVDQVNKGDRIQIKNGYVNEWQGELQLTTGKFGSFEILGKSSNEKVQAITDDELTEKDALAGEKKSREHVLTDDEVEEEKKFEEPDDDNQELDVEEENI